MFCCIVSERPRRRLALVASHPANINKAKLRAQLMSCQAAAHRSSWNWNWNWSQSGSGSREQGVRARQTFVQFGDDLCSSCSRDEKEEGEE